MAALESGVTTTTETIFDPGYWKYPSATWENNTNCWKRSGHGKMNVTSAITNSCNTYFMEMGYRMGLDTLNEYYSALGLGEPTGIEIGESTGRQAVNESGQDQARGQLSARPIRNIPRCSLPTTLLLLSPAASITPPIF